MGATLLRLAALALLFGACGSDPVDGSPAILGGGADTSMAGQAQGGNGGANAEAGASGDAGAGGGVACDSDDDCDDAIDCTMDACYPDGCYSEPDDRLCLSPPGECHRCQADAGCVPQPLRTTELLENGSFDEGGGWDESSTYWIYVIFTSPNAHTAPAIASFGPTPVGEVTQEHALLSQMVFIPETTQKLTLSGRYRFLPGGTGLDINDSTRLTLFDGAGATVIHPFTVWLGSEPQEFLWQEFSFEVTRAQLTNVLGGQARLEFEAYAWDSEFSFDSLSMGVEHCQ